VHELDGLLALRTREYVRAAQELSLANQRDPWVLYQLALAHQARGDREGARAAAREAAEFNELNFNWAFAREKARKLRARLG
jgi:hypothetical protein